MRFFHLKLWENFWAKLTLFFSHNPFKGFDSSTTTLKALHTSLGVTSATFRPHFTRAISVLNRACPTAKLLTQNLNNPELVVSLRKSLELHRSNSLWTESENILCWFQAWRSPWKVLGFNGGQRVGRVDSLQFWPKIIAYQDIHNVTKGLKLNNCGVHKWEFHITSQCKLFNNLW